MPGQAAAAIRAGNLLSHLSSSQRRQPPRAAHAWGRPSGPVNLPNGELFEYWDPPFTTRPELKGTFGMVSSYEPLASAAGMRVLELGGNAFDASIATGSCLWHTEPGMLSPGGEVPIVYYAAAEGRLMTVEGQGPLPAVGSTLAPRPAGSASSR